MKLRAALLTVSMAVVVAVAVTFFGFFDTQVNLKRRAPIAQPPFEVIRFPPFDLQSHAPCEEILTNDWAFPAYKAALNALSEVTEPEMVPFLACFLPGWDTSLDAEATRRAFVGEVFFSEVLYGYLAREFEAVLANSLKTGVAKHWPIMRHGESALLGYQRTGDTAYIDLYIKFFDRVMLLRDSKLGYYDNWHEKTMDSWGSYKLARKYGYGDSWISHVTHFAIVMMPATGFAREILANPDLSEYREWADSVVAFFDRAYPQFDVDLRAVEGTDEQWYWRPVREMYEAVNHIHVVGQALLNIYAITGNPVYRERINAILRVFEKTMTINGDGLASWNYSPYFQVKSAQDERNTAMYSEPTWKGAITVPFLYLAAQDGFTMSDGVLEAVTRSITDHILADAIPKLHTHPKDSRSLTDKELKHIATVRKEQEGKTLKTSRMPRKLREVARLENNFAGFNYASTVAPEVSRLMREYVANNPEIMPLAWFTQHASAPGYAMSLSPR